MYKISFSHNKIIYKVKNANTPRMKGKRHEVTLLILTAHIKNFEFLYIDEISFNLEMRLYYGWSRIPEPARISKPQKPKNYSAVACNDMKGGCGYERIVAVQIVKGGVKAPDLFSSHKIL